MAATSDTEPAAQNAVDIAAQVAAGTLRATDALEAAIDRYEAHNDTYNAVVLTRTEAAYQAAAAVDAKVAAGEPVGPLAGVPMTIKEGFDWVGTPTTWGNPNWADYQPERNAVCVGRLIDAGAVIYGKTNVPYLLGDWQSFNDIYGTTSNPWDVTRTPGGSSGGSAVALATGMATLELGSDIGGSLRNPAHFCGVFSHKPTFDVVPTAGHTAPMSITSADIAVCGPMARCAADLAVALDVMAGPAGDDATGYRLALPTEQRDELSAFKVAVMLETPVVATDTAMIGVLADAVDALAAAGAQVTYAAPEIDQHAFHENYLAVLRGATGAHAPDDAYGVYEEGQRLYAAGERTPAAVAGHFATVSHRDWMAAHEQRTRYRAAWAAFFADYDVMLCPVATSVAFSHDHTGTRATRTIEVNGNPEPCVDALFWAGWSCSVYLPTTTVPVGFQRGPGLGEGGLPVGIGVIAPMFHDHRAIAFGRLIEEHLGGFVAPPLA